MILASLLHALVQAVVALPPQAERVEPHSLAEIRLLDPATRNAARQVGVALDCQARLPGGRAEIVVTDSQLAEMRRLGASVIVLQTELENFYRSRFEDRRDDSPSSTAIDWDGGSMGGYFTLLEMEQILDQLTLAYPAICTPKFSIGLSVEGRDLWAVKVSDNPNVDEDEPEARIDSLHHAREPMSMHTSLYFLAWLLEGYGVDPLATHLVNEREIWIVPAVNPDGYEYNRSTDPGGGGMWRKNRRDNGGGSFGVDLNRNYSYQWGYDNSGSSGNPNSETYRGPSPASEPETQAMEAFISSHAFRTAISAHTYGDLWLFPWGYECFDPPQVSEFELIAEWFTVENHYISGSICPTLYPANGDTVDYDFGVHATWSGTIEIGGGGDGFWPPTSRIVPLLELNFSAYQRTMLYAAAGLESDDWILQQSAGDGDRWYEPGEVFDLALTLVNAGTLATNTNATVTVTANHADVEILAGFHDFGTIAAFGQADNLATPLQIRIAAGSAYGGRVQVKADLAYDGYVESHTWDLVLGEPVQLDADDLETDLGWALGEPSDTANRGNWEISDPEQTTSLGNTVQPGDDHSAIGVLCAVTDGTAGSGAGSFDVDSGVTTLMSPKFDFEDPASPLLSYWRWFSDLTTDDDELVVEISADDGATWTMIERVDSHDNSWQQVFCDVGALGLGTLTDRMRLRWRIADDPNNSLAEALVDDVEFLAFQPVRVALWRYGTPSLGGTIRIHVQGDDNQSFALFLALAGGWFPLRNLGVLELDPTTMFVLFASTTGSSGRATLEGAIPNDPALPGVEVHLQALVLDAAGAYLTNAVDFTIE